jgi:hypothetical protein
MGFHELIDKVQQAETALEAQERQAAADWRQFKASWRSIWTPGRIVLAGVASGFLFGSARPLRGVGSGQGLLQLVTALSGLFASGSAHAAAEHAEEAAAVDAANDAVAGDPDATLAAAALHAQRLYREAGLP